MVRRHVLDDDTRHLFEATWGVTLEPEPGLRIPNMFDAALEGSFKGLYLEGEDIAQSDPNTQHVTAALEAMECIVVQDLFLNETAKFAHVFLPGSSFLEKNGTFISQVENLMARARSFFSTLRFATVTPTSSASATNVRPRRASRRHRAAASRLLPALEHVP